MNLHPSWPPGDASPCWSGGSPARRRTATDSEQAGPFKSLITLRCDRRITNSTQAGPYNKVSGRPPLIGRLSLRLYRTNLTTWLKLHGAWANGSHGADQEAQVATYTLFVIAGGTASFGIPSYGLMGTIVAGNVTAAAAHTFVTVYLGINHVVAV